MNGIKEIKLKSDNNITYTDKCELFDPRKVKYPANLPDYWKMVYDNHNKPEMRDCRDLAYRYVYVPFLIMPQHPRVLCKGIFCLTDRSIRSDRIKAEDLVHILKTDGG